MIKHQKAILLGDAIEGLAKCGVDFSVLLPNNGVGGSIDLVTNLIERQISFNLVTDEDSNEVLNVSGTE
jgi:hypothetical protein